MECPLDLTPLFLAAKLSTSVDFSPVFLITNHHNTLFSCDVMLYTILKDEGLFPWLVALA